MALTVETGSNVSGADCYADRAAFDLWEPDYFEAVSNGSDTAKEAAIRRVVAYLNSLSWKGSRTNGRGQALAWPRTDVTDAEGNEIASNEIPAEVIFAQHRLTRAELASPGLLDAEFKSGDAVKREKVGDLEVEYARPAGVADDARTVVAMALDAIQGLLVGGDATGGGTIWVNRA